MYLMACCNDVYQNSGVIPVRVSEPYCLFTDSKDEHFPQGGTCAKCCVSNINMNVPVIGRKDVDWIDLA